MTVDEFSMLATSRSPGVTASFHARPPFPTTTRSRATAGISLQTGSRCPPPLTQSSPTEAVRPRQRHQGERLSSEPESILPTTVTGVIPLRLLPLYLRR